MTLMHQNSCIAMATCKAHGMLSRHALQHRCAAILGKPLPQLDRDYKFDATKELHIQAGEVLAQAALQIEILVFHVAQVPHAKYIGRSQDPRIKIFQP